MLGQVECQVKHEGQSFPIARPLMAHPLTNLCPVVCISYQAVFNSQHHAVVQELARPFPGDRQKGRWVTVGRALEVAPPGASTPAAIDLPTWEREILKEDPSNAITSVDPNEAGALGVPSDGQEATVLIPNRSRNQYIRQVREPGDMHG